VIQFPYGIADFRRIRREGLVYVDRTAYIRELESLGSVLVYLRPRRFGKSLWIQTLATYYDLRYADAFDELFGDLAIGREPTPLRNRYFVLQWNFSLISPRGGVGEIAECLLRHVRTQAELFLQDYGDLLEADIPQDAGVSEILTLLLGAVRRAGHPLYLLIDEYDNFVNEVMVRDVDVYKALLEGEGAFKELMKAVKNATEGLGLERIFITGVSPVASNDLTSGFNIATDVSLAPELATLCGFEEAEIRGLLSRVAEERGLPGDEAEKVIEVMRTWYNGHRFSEGAETLVYNPTNALYFLQHLQRHGAPPQKLHDANLRTDRAKLAFLARTAAGTGVVERLAEGDGEIWIPRLLDTFSLGDLTARLDKDSAAIASFLYYMGLLTLTDLPGRLRIPNLVVRKLFLDRLLEVLLTDVGESSEARQVAMLFFESGDLEPLLSFFEDKLLPTLSNRDLGAPPRRPGASGGGVNEMTLKALFLAILFDDQRFVVHSELEVEKGYVDLCLLVRPENPFPKAFDILFELKLVRGKALGETAKGLRAMDEARLRALPAVKKALAEGREQVARYSTALARRRGDAVPLRSYVVVAVGLERMVGEEVRGK
jgi:hypothetical protein